MTDENSEQEKEKEVVTIKEIIQAIKRIPLDFWINIFFLCLMGYIVVRYYRDIAACNTYYQAILENMSFIKESFIYK